jgi:hypothetical protein
MMVFQKLLLFQNKKIITEYEQFTKSHTQLEKLQVNEFFQFT